MAVLRKNIIIPALALMLTGCYEDFDPEVDTVPVLAINSLITAGERIEAEVTHTWMYSEGTAEKVNPYVDDAVVTVYVNEVQVGKDYIAGEGDRVMIVAESPTYGRAEAQVTVPHALSGVSVNASVSITSLTDTVTVFDADILVTLSDRGATDDYYRLAWSGEGDFSPGEFDERSEPIFSEHIGAFETLAGAEAEGFTLFTDRQFAGGSYTLHLRFKDASVRTYAADGAYQLELQGVSESFYNWAVYQWQTDNGLTGDIIDFGFGDPVWGYSNVSTGAGVVAARTVRRITVSLRDLLTPSL